MAIQTKRGVSLAGLQQPMLDALTIAEQVYRRYGATLVVTSATDGRHMENSLHYVGLAADLRIRDIGDSRLESIYFDLSAQLAAVSKRFQVILESGHIHVEYDRRVTDETFKDEQSS